MVPQKTGVDAGSVRLGARRWTGARRWPGAAGRPVLLVHGLSSNARLWDMVAGRLAELADEAVRSLPDGSRLEEFPSGDHDLHAQHPDRVAEAIGELT